MEEPTPYKKATEQDTLKIFNAIWYTVAQRIVERIIEVSDLDEDRATALRRAALRPMDFRVVVE